MSSSGYMRDATGHFKEKKVGFFENINPQNKRLRLQSTSESNNKEDVTDDAKRKTSVDNPNTLNTATSSLAVLAEVAQSHSSQFPYLI